jgi:hypothetical protein
MRDFAFPVWLRPLLGLFLGAPLTVVALRQEPRSDPWSPEPALFNTDTFFRWWQEPVERNAFRRVAFISEDIRDVYMLADGQRGWAVGSNGTILATADGGNDWHDPLLPYRRLPAPWYWPGMAFVLSLLLISQPHRRRKRPLKPSARKATVPPDPATICLISDR